MEIIPLLKRASNRLFISRQRDLGLDFHNHLLPGVDDGMADFGETCAAIAALKTVGFTGAVITPHIYHDVYDNAAHTLRAQLRQLVTRLNEAGVDFPLYLSAEYFADEYFLELIKRGELLWLPVGRERWVLLEFPYYDDDQLSAVCISALAARGYRPVIAHVERYHYVARAKIVWLSRFARANALLQGDIGSLAGQHGEEPKRFSRWLLAKNLVQLWGSDLHKPSQVEDFISPGLKHLAFYQRLNPVLDQIVPELS